MYFALSVVKTMSATFNSLAMDSCSVEPPTRKNRRTAPTLQPKSGSGEGLENFGEGPGLGRIGGGDAVGAGDGFFFSGSGSVGIDGPVVQRADPRCFVGKGLEDFGVIEGEDFVLGAVSAEAGEEAYLNGGVNLLELGVGGVGGINAKLTFGFPLVDEFLAEIHDHEVGGMDFDAFGCII